MKKMMMSVVVVVDDNIVKVVVVVMVVMIDVVVAAAVFVAVDSELKAMLKIDMMLLVKIVKELGHYILFLMV